MSPIFDTASSEWTTDGCRPSLRVHSVPCGSRFWRTDGSSSLSTNSRDPFPDHNHRLSYTETPRFTHSLPRRPVIVSNGFAWSSFRRHQSPSGAPIPTDDLDRGLPATLAGVAYGVVLGVLFDLPLGWLLGLRGVWLFAFAIVAGIVMGIMLTRMTTAITEGTASAILYALWPSGRSTPYVPTYSLEQALAAKGDHDGALVAYRHAMRLNPMDPEPRFQAAEMLFRSGTPGKAVAFFDEGRRLSGDDRGRELYATQRLIDLYLGPLHNDIRVLVELRRLAERFPGTREAEAAHQLLARLKQEQGIGNRESGIGNRE